MTNSSIPENKTSGKNSPEPIKTRLSIVSHFGKIAAEYALITALLGAISGCAIVDVNSRPAFVHGVSGILIALVTKPKPEK